MARMLMLRETLTCDQHDDAVIIHRSIVMCPMCRLEAQLEDVRELAKDLQEDLKALAGGEGEPAPAANVVVIGEPKGGA